MKQSTLDNTPYRPRKRFKENYKKCIRRHCTKSAEMGSDLCPSCGIDHILNYHFALDEFLIPQITGMTAEEYYKIRRRQAFEQFVLENRS